MSNYVQTTFFAPKDALLTGNPLKLIKGADVDPEFAAIAAAIATKFDSSSVSSAPVGFADGTAAAPGITFASQTNMGFFRVGNNDLGVAVAGVKVLDLQAAIITAFGSVVAGVATTAVTNTSTVATQDALEQITAGSSVFKAYVANQSRATAVVTSGPTVAQAALFTTTAIPIVFGINGIYAGQIDANGAWIIPAPVAGNALTVFGLANAFTTTINGNSTAGQSQGLQVVAGTNASDTAFRVLNQAASATFLQLFGDGHGTLGPTNVLGFSWNTAGAITIATPSAGVALSASGVASGAVFQASPSATGAGVAFYSGVALTVALGMTSSGTDFCKIQNDAGNTWSIATNNAIASLGTPVFQWTNNAAPSLKGRGPVAAALVDMTPDTGTFTATYATGFTTSPTATYRWVRNGNQVTLFLAVLTATSNATGWTITGLPAAIQPTRTQALAINVCEDNSVQAANTAVQVTAASGTITMLRNSLVAGWTASGVKGTFFDATVTYLLN